MAWQLKHCSAWSFISLLYLAFQGNGKLRIVWIWSWKQEKLKALKTQADYLPNVNFQCSQKEGGGLCGTIWTSDLWSTYHLMMVMGVGNVGFLKKCTQSRLYLKKHTCLLLEQGATTPREKLSWRGRTATYFYRDILAQPITLPPSPFLFFFKHWPRTMLIFPLPLGKDGEKSKPQTQHKRITYPLSNHCQPQLGFVTHKPIDHSS